ncbi:MAG: DNA methyltransferase [bacterium]|nr:DNA methyltransferase [bacterium]
MIYAFILGRIFTLSVAEVLSVFEREKMDYEILTASAEILMVKMAKPIRNEQTFLNDLGGIVKIINILGEENKVSDLENAFTADKLINHYPNIKPELENIPSVKLYWGISVYFICSAELQKKQKIVKQIQSYLFSVKEVLHERDMKCRIVTPPPNKFTLDAPNVEKNNLLKKGGEIAVLVDKEKTYWGKTLAIQDFRFYGLRDFGRPARSMKVGMMPPKLAQVMINLAEVPKDDKILDPFCGTGVVLQEAMLMGHSVIGTDSNSATIALAKQNLEWLIETMKRKDPKSAISKEMYQLFQADARLIAKPIQANSISAIVTEGTLGPKYGRILPSDKQMQDNFKNLEKLYLDVFAQFKTILKKDGRVVISFPVYIIKGTRQEFIPFLDKLVQLGYNIKRPIKADELKGIPLLALSKNGTIVYSRPDQNVGREIVIFTKK